VSTTTSQPPRRRRARAEAPRPGPAERRLGATASRLGLPGLEHALTILRTTSSLVATTLATSGLGFAYWWVAARSFTPAEVGLSSAAVSAMLLLSRLGSQGIGTALAGELPRYGGPRSALLLPGVLASGTIGLGLGLGFALVAPVAVPALAPLASNPLAVLVFAAGVALSSIGSVLDQALIGLLQGGMQLLRNVIFAAGKLVILGLAALAAVGVGLAVFGTWVAGELLSILVLGLIALRHPAVSRVLDWRTFLSFTRHAAAHHLLGVARFAPTLLMPIIVAGMFSAESNATFYVALLIAAMVQLVSSSSTFTLYAVARNRPSGLTRQIRLTLLLSLAAAIPGILVMAVAGTQILSLFGPTYAENGGITLTLLALTSLPLLVRDHWVALRRIRDQVASAAVLIALAAAVEVTAAVAGGLLGGIEGLALGWLLGLCAGSAFQVPAVLRATGIGGRGGVQRH